MAATTSAFGVLPILAYAFASLLLVYLSLRLARYLKSRQASALPKPVSGAPSKSKTLLGGARSTASSWRQWSQSLPLPALAQVRVPWIRIPSLSESSVDNNIGGTIAGTAPAKTKNGKNLAIELLPTTGLPPPPSSAPIFSPTPTRTSTPGPQQQQPQQANPGLHPQHQQLIDIGSPPSTPGLTAGSTAASGSSFPGSPRTPSPPHIGHGYPPKAVYTPHPTVHTPAPRTVHSPPYHARSLSPHTLLATTSPVKQKRSRSLGGVPVRRLSGGAGSSLRHAVDLEDGAVEMSLFGRKAPRGKGEEQLLIDFSSSGAGSGAGGAADELDDPFVSPAASDIGVLSLNSTSQPSSSSSVYTAYASSGPYAHSGYKVAPSVVSAAATMATTALPLRVDARQVGRHVPLVDLSDSDTPTSGFDEDGWKWFGAGAGASPAKSTAIATAVAVAKAPVPVAKAVVGEKEKLVDIDDDSVSNASGPVLGAPGQAFAAPSVVREEPRARLVKEDTGKKEMPLVELDAADEKEGILVDVGFDDEDEERWARQAYPPQAIQFDDEERFGATEKDNIYSNETLHDEHRNDIDDPNTDDTHDATPETKNDDAFIRSPSHSARAAPTPLLESKPIADPHTPATSVLVGFPAEQAPNNASWAWDDPWSGHLVAPEPNRVDFVQSEDLIELELGGHAGMMMDEEKEEEKEEEKARPAESEDVSSAQEVDEEVVENSPAGLLKATVLDEDEDDESVPSLDLESLDLDAFVPFEEPEEVGGGEHEAFGESVVPVADDEEAQALEEEEEITPTPTPASVHAELPPAALPEIMLVDVEAPQGLDDPAEVFYPDPELMQLNDAWTSSRIDSVLHEKEVVVLQETELFPDPDLLPLPVTDEEEKTETAEDTLDAVRSQLLAIADKARPSTPTLSQTPTPPASPPPLHPISTSSAFLRPTKSRSASRVPSPTGAVSISSAIAFPSGAIEDKENAVLTPTTVYAQQQRPAWSLRAADAPALGLPSSGSPIGASPRARRKALEDVNWDVADEKQEVVMMEQQTEKVEALPVKATEEPRDEGQEDERQVQKEEEQVTPVESAELAAPGLEPSTSLPGAFPEPSPPAIVVSPPAASSSTSTISFPSASPTSDTPTSKDAAPSSPTTCTTPTSATTSTVAQRLRRASLTARAAWTMPSTRTLVRSPLDIALAMQMRPGLGAGADPAWMVRFLMAVYGWLLVSVAGGDF